MAIENLLKILGMKDTDSNVETAISGQKALDIIQQDLNTKNHSSFDLIFIDLNMPGMNGCEATSKIRSLLYSLDLEQPLIIGNSGQTE